MYFSILTTLPFLGTIVGVFQVVIFRLACISEQFFEDLTLSEILLLPLGWVWVIV